MANGDIGSQMAQQEIKRLLNLTEKKLTKPPCDSHCPDHSFQQQVNHAMLLGISALLSTETKNIDTSYQLKATVVSATVSGIMIGIAIIVKVFF